MLINKELNATQSVYPDFWGHLKVSTESSLSFDCNPETYVSNLHDPIMDNRRLHNSHVPSSHICYWNNLHSLWPSHLFSALKSCCLSYLLSPPLISVVLALHYFQFSHNTQALMAAASLYSMSTIDADNRNHSWCCFSSATDPRVSASWI